MFFCSGGETIISRTHHPDYLDSSRSADNLSSTSNTMMYGQDHFSKYSSESLARLQGLPGADTLSRLSMGGDSFSKLTDAHDSLARLTEAQDSLARISNMTNSISPPHSTTHSSLSPGNIFSILTTIDCMF